jgi:Zn-dependent protease with chaperone function
LATTFFEQQHAARQTSRSLIWLFVAAVVAIVIAVNVVLGTAYLYVFTPHGSWTRYGLNALPPYFLTTTTAVVLLMIVGGSVQQVLAMREGGEAVARMVGARPVDPSSQDLLERRLLNVVEEMALASGVPTPRVYVLERQDTINAFAAGLHPGDAVVTVTHGTLTRLTRDELQGVIGHEFSHILNGDMTLNIRLIGLLQGLLLLAMFGRFLADMDRVRVSSDSRDRGNVLFAVGIAIVAIGYIGVIFGRLIKAGVSRQRECLADASSVQFTRNRDGIGGALRKIGGLGDGAGGQIDHPHAETLSHMFMAPVRLNFASGWLATHPPLEERIRHIYGRPMDFLPAPELVRGGSPPLPQTPELPPLPFGTGALAAATGTSAAGSAGVASVSPVGGLAGTAAGGALQASIGRPHPASRPFVEQLLARVEALGLRPALSDTTGAQLLALGLLIDQEQEMAARQMQSVVQAFGPDASAQVEAIRAAAAQMPPGWRLPLVDLAFPTLRKLPVAARNRLLMLAHTLIVADGRITLPEFLLYTVLEARLGAGVEGVRAVRYSSLRDLAAEASLVLSLIAAVRMPEALVHAYQAGARELEGVAAAPVRRDALALDDVSAALRRLNALAPLTKPQLIKACLAVAFVDGSTNWKAASCLRTLCAALDCPLPPQVDADAATQGADF